MQNPKQSRISEFFETPKGQNWRYEGLNLKCGSEVSETKTIHFQSLELAQKMAKLLNGVEPLTTYRNSADREGGYWTTLPTHTAGEGNKWEKFIVNANAKVTPYDGLYSVSFHEMFYEQAKTFAKTLENV